MSILSNNEHLPRTGPNMGEFAPKQQPIEMEDIQVRNRGKMVTVSVPKDMKIYRREDQMITVIEALNGLFKFSEDAIPNKKLALELEEIVAVTKIASRVASLLFEMLLQTKDARKKYRFKNPYLVKPIVEEIKTFYANSHYLIKVGASFYLNGKFKIIGLVPVEFSLCEECKNWVGPIHHARVNQRRYHYCISCEKEHYYDVTDVYI
jgi:hypothetical protein